MSQRSLEDLLLLAAQEPEYRDAFYQKLLQSDLYILGGEGASEGESVEDEISLQEWVSDEGERAIPFFTSYKLLEKAVGEGAVYLEIKGALLLASTVGNNLMMNPGFATSKMFYPDEIEMILTTEFDVDDDEGAEFSEDIAIRPITNKRSVEMLKALKSYFTNTKGVVRAYVAAMNEHENDDESHLVIGVDTDDDVAWEPLFRDMMAIVLEKSPQKEIVDLFKLDTTQKEGMSAYFIHEMKPFYLRKS
ncbi:MAG: hypothetical protein DSZ06_03145 [Sulfurospirillum sp.]|nr:MAG: hypothetical protein DSZ06_03145 [Sulfurospirillum sp.]